LKLADQIQLRPMRALAWGIIWRTVALGMGYGALFGSIYGLFYPLLGTLSFNEDPITDSVIIGAALEGLVGWLLGGVIGLTWGLVIGLIEGVLLSLATYVAIRKDARVSSYRRLVTAASVALVGVAHMILFLWAPVRPTVMLWFVNVGLPVLIVTLAFWHISYFVTKWVAGPSPAANSSMAPIITLTDATEGNGQH
jgi:hypothetical protein